MNEDNIVYMLVYSSPELKPEFVKVMGIFKTKKDALKRRQHIYDHHKVETHIQRYIVF